MDALGQEGKVVIFQIGTGSFALSIDAVREVVPYSPPMAVPDAPPAVEGVMDLRGDVFPVIELARLLGIQRVRDASDARIMVVEVDGHRAGLVVDDVSEVRAVSPEMLTPPSPLYTTGSEAIVAGILRLGERQLVVLVDPTRMVAGAQVSLG